MRRPKQYWVPSELALYDRLKETPEFQDRPAIYEREPGVVLVRGALDRIREDASQGRAIRLWMDWFYDNPHLEPLRKVYPTAKFTFA
jgi:hypothetical protein